MPIARDVILILIGFIQIGVVFTLTNLYTRIDSNDKRDQTQGEAIAALAAISSAAATLASAEKPNQEALARIQSQLDAIQRELEKK